MFLNCTLNTIGKYFNLNTFNRLFALSKTSELPGPYVIIEYNSNEYNSNEYNSICPNLSYNWCKNCYFENYNKEKQFTVLICPRHTPKSVLHPNFYRSSLIPETHFY